MVFTSNASGTVNYEQRSLSFAETGMPLQVGLGYMNHIGALNYGIEGYARHYTGWGEGIDLGVNAALKMAF